MNVHETSCCLKTVAKICDGFSTEISNENFFSHFVEIICESLILYFYYLFIYLFIHSFFFCREYVKIFDGNGTIQFYKTGCWASSQTASLFEVPFGKSSNITVNILLTKLNSLVNVQFVVLKTGLHSGTYIVLLNCADILKRKKKIIA